jgi:hypothetical protein
MCKPTAYTDTNRRVWMQTVIRGCSVTMCQLSSLLCAAPSLHDSIIIWCNETIMKSIPWNIHVRQLGTEMPLRHFAGVTFKQIPHKRQADRKPTITISWTWRAAGDGGRRNVSPEKVFFILSLHMLVYSGWASEIKLRTTSALCWLTFWSKVKQKGSWVWRRGRNAMKGRSE